MKKIFLVFLAIFIPLSGLYFLTSEKIAKEDTNTPEIVLVKKGDSIYIDVNNVEIKKDGFLVLRQFIKNEIGQILEISKFLKEGFHENIKVDLSGIEFEEDKMAVVLYADNGDGAFNSFSDNLYVDSEGDPYSYSVHDNKKIEMETLSLLIKSANNIKTENVAKEISYTENGYIPNEVSVKVGDRVRFVNDSDREMWVASDDHPAHFKLPTFDQFGTSERYGVYEYTFKEAGSWGYHDHVNPSFVGVINVK